MAFPLPVPKAFLDRLLPKDLKATKGDVAVMAMGGVVGLAVDLALLPVGVITGGSAAAAGAATAFSAKAGVESLGKRFKQRKHKKRARERALRAFKVFEGNGYDKGAAALAKVFDLYEQDLITGLELDAAVDKQLEAYKKASTKRTAPRMSDNLDALEETVTELAALNARKSKPDESAPHAGKTSDELLKELREKLHKSNMRQLDIDLLE
ncbi:hypothetical protein A5641_04365 [Mycobacterium sp. 1554424.7]|nr:hypothetical protein A5641_04365 [Mycobacterium sp. 1554424.7]